MAGSFRILSLRMSGYRGIRDSTIEFADGPVTVLAGKNGAGKSSVLDCLAILFRGLFAALAGARSSRRQFTAKDLSNDRSEMSCSVRFTVPLPFQAAPDELDWSLTVKRLSKGDIRAVTRSPSNQGTLTLLKDLLLEETGPELPLTIHYGIERADIDASAPADELIGRSANPYDQALEPGSGHFRSFVHWFREQEDAENAEIVRRGVRSRRRPVDPSLDAVRRAVESFLPGFSDLHIERKPSPRLVVRKGPEQLDVDQLSHGERSLLAMVGDLARRLAMVNRGGGDPLRSPGWVFIDEMELHLHPSWQRSVIPRLCQTFPQCQFVITTHSPQVLADVPASAVRRLRRKDADVVAEQPAAGTQGRDSNAILEDVLETPDRPESTLRDLQEIARLIDQERLEEAQRGIDQLARVLTDKDAEIVRLRSLIDFLGHP
ncbi:MAG TPA: AAA family ATPase [Polyangia bacterium]|jgi:predicted ATP-binding protein involved in virulence|nr:AAA family ATPase [Polyangia bacterium]